MGTSEPSCFVFRMVGQFGDAACGSLQKMFLSGIYLSHKYDALMVSQSVRTSLRIISV